MTSKLAIRSPRTRAGRASAALLGLSAVAGLGLLAWLFLGRGVQPAQESDSTTPAPEDRPDLTPTSQAASSSALRAADPLPAEGNSRSASSQATPEPAPPPWKDFPVEITPAVRERLERFGETEDDYRRAQWAIAETENLRMRARIPAYAMILDYGLKSDIIRTTIGRLNRYLGETPDSERYQSLQNVLESRFDEMAHNSLEAMNSVDPDFNDQGSYVEIARRRERFKSVWLDYQKAHEIIKENLVRDIEAILAMPRSNWDYEYSISIR